MLLNPLSLLGRLFHGAWVDARELADLRGRVAAVGRAQPSIEFDLDGIVLGANESFLNTSGYKLAEIRGQHHRMFVDPEARDTPEYKAFWEKLRRGEHQSAQYRRVARNGRPVWVQATYYPIPGRNGKPFKVVKYTNDITEQMLAQADGAGQLVAISKAQAVIEFDLNGTVRTANDNFLRMTGYTLDEVRGQHHHMFVEPAQRESPAYRAFWAKLGRGEYDAARYKCIGRGGRELWIQASYNPILDAGGRPFKVVQYATDITEQVSFAEQLRDAVAETQAAVTAAADGDLTRRISMDGKTGELAALSRGVNALIDVMMSLVKQIKEAAAEVQTGANGISSGNANLAQRTDEQAASLEETASSMEQMASTVKQTAANAGHANQLAVAACAQAEKGGAVVGAAVTAMSGINAASGKIADIIGVIDSIAFQTNLLALNAAVEAARAGDQGRGFAVVASEVRSLAGRSATAAKEIKTLIQDSVSRVAEGSRLVDESGRTLTEIVASVQKVTSIVAEIAAASREQSAGIEQVNTAIMRMDETTQQNAAMVEQAAAASQAIVEQAQTLNGMIAHYDVGDGGDAAASRGTSAFIQSAPAAFAQRRA